MSTYTTEELIQYLYNETSEENSRTIEKALEADYTLRDKCEALQQSMQGLDSILTSPRPQSVMAILNYARNTVEVEQP